MEPSDAAADFDAYELAALVLERVAEAEADGKFDENSRPEATNSLPESKNEAEADGKFDENSRPEALNSLPAAINSQPEAGGASEIPEGFLPREGHVILEGGGVTYIIPRGLLAVAVVVLVGVGVALRVVRRPR